MANDTPFGLPVTGADVGVASGDVGVAGASNEQRLIQTGLLTPFGSSVDTPAESAQAGECSTGSGGGVEVSSGPTADLASSKKGASLKLCSEGFDGLFSDDLPYKRRIARIPKKKGDTSERSKDSSGSRDNSTPSNSHASLLEQNDECNNEVTLSGGEEDDWMPSLAEMLESDASSSAESEYLTDEELGETEGSRRRKRNKKKKKLRPLSPDELSEEEGASPKRRKNKRRKTTNYSDDGDKHLYQQRLRYV